MTINWVLQIVSVFVQCVTSVDGTFASSRVVAVDIDDSE